jgi:hypothetical protein
MDNHADAAVLRTGSGVALTVRRAGSGDPVLLLHGSGGPDTVSLLVSHLAEDHRVLAPIHPGWGGTLAPENPGHQRRLRPPLRLGAPGRSVRGDPGRGPCAHAGCAVGDVRHPGRVPGVALDFRP